MLAILITCTGYATAGVYRWIDENGQINFSDKPQVGAKQIKLKETSVYTPPVGSQPNEDEQTGQDENAEEGEASGEPVNYELIAIVSPENNKVLRSNEGKADISVELRPGLQKGHKIRIYLDGAPTGTDLETTQITLQNTDRGTHSVEVSVIDANNKELIRSSSISFHMLRLAEPRTAPFELKQSEG